MTVTTIYYDYHYDCTLRYYVTLRTPYVVAIPSVVCNVAHPNQTVELFDNIFAYMLGCFSVIITFVAIIAVTIFTFNQSELPPKKS